MDETLAYYGGAVKALGGGKIAGYGVLFTADPDLQGELFTKGTDLELEVGDRRSIYYRHGVHPVIKDRKLGKATLKEVDEAGAFFEGELNLRDDYEKYIYKLAEMGKLGWSTGSMPHLVRKEMRTDKSMEITSWPIGEISLTPSPVEARTSAFPVKSLEGEDELDTFIKSQEVQEVKEPEFGIDGVPFIKAYCESVSPNCRVMVKGYRSDAAAHAVGEFITIAKILGEAIHSHKSLLVRRTEHRFLKDGNEIDASTLAQTETVLASLDQAASVFEAVKEPLLGIKAIGEKTKAEQRAMSEKAKLAVWNYYRISGYTPEELQNGSQHV